MASRLENTPLVFDAAPGDRDLRVAIKDLDLALESALAVMIQSQTILDRLVTAQTALTVSLGRVKSVPEPTALQLRVATDRWSTMVAELGRLLEKTSDIQSQVASRLK